jgi:hypothetical protein
MSMMTIERQKHWDRILKIAILVIGPAMWISLVPFRVKPLLVLWSWVAVIFGLVFARIVVRSGLMGGQITDRS